MTWHLLVFDVDTKVDSRFTIIDAQGRVLADSRKAFAEMDWDVFEHLLKHLNTFLSPHALGIKKLASKWFNNHAQQVPIHHVFSAH